MPLDSFNKQMYSKPSDWQFSLFEISRLRRDWQGRFLNSVQKNCGNGASVIKALPGKRVPKYAWFRDASKRTICLSGRLDTQ
jgi:hypothetical protein